MKKVFQNSTGIQTVKMIQEKDEYLYQKQLKYQKYTKEQLKEPKQFMVQILPDQKFKVTLHQAYIIDKTHKYYDQIQTWVLLANEKKQKNAGKGIKLRFNLQYYPSFQFELSQSKMQEEICPICLCQFEIKQNEQMLQILIQQNPDDVYMTKCQHKFHLECIKHLIGEKDWFKCPICNQIIGKMTGDQPEGTMTPNIDPSITVLGYGKGAIVIKYQFKSGVRNGVPFSGTSRIAYLPNTEEGHQVLQLLREAFNRRLIFTVGRSVTTGLDNQTVWNGIHHKTSTYGGPACFGYPDPTYLSRVKQQLALKGVTLESINFKKK